MPTISKAMVNFSRCFDRFDNASCKKQKNIHIWAARNHIVLGDSEENYYNIGIDVTFIARDGYVINPRNKIGKDTMENIAQYIRTIIRVSDSKNQWKRILN